MVDEGVTGVVVDASTALALLCFPDGISDSDGVLMELEGMMILVLTVWDLEIAKCSSDR